MPRDERLIAALKRERAGYLARGLEDRAAQVDEQLQIHGHEAVEVPEGRASLESVQQTADAEPTETASQETPPAEEAKTPEPETPAEKRRGRPKLPRDADGNVIRE